jgi:hypothetical protein
MPQVNIQKESLSTNIDFYKFSKSQFASKIPRYEKPRWMEDILHQLIDGLSHYL